VTNISKPLQLKLISHLYCGTCYWHSGLLSVDFFQFEVFAVMYVGPKWQIYNINRYPYHIYATKIDTSNTYIQWKSIPLTHIYNINGYPITSIPQKSILDICIRGVDFYCIYVLGVSISIVYICEGYQFLLYICIRGIDFYIPLTHIYNRNLYPSHIYTIQIDTPNTYIQ
jgi:hypothetical protein